jgi:hypothetical protein
VHGGVAQVGGRGLGDDRVFGSAGPFDGQGDRTKSGSARFVGIWRGLAVRLYTDRWWSSPARCHGNYTAAAEGWMTASANRIDVY